VIYEYFECHPNFFRTATPEPAPSGVNGVIFCAGEGGCEKTPDLKRGPVVGRGRRRFSGDGQRRR